MTLTVTALTGAPAAPGPSGTHGAAGDAGFSSALGAAMGEQSAARPGPAEAAPERAGHRVGRHGRGGDAAERACGDPASADAAQTEAGVAAPLTGSPSDPVASGGSAAQGTAEGTAPAALLSGGGTACAASGASAPSDATVLLTGPTPGAGTGQAGASGSLHRQPPMAAAANPETGAAVLAGAGTGEPASASPPTGVAGAGSAFRTAAMLPAAQADAPGGVPALDASTALGAAPVVTGQQGAVGTAAGGAAPAIAPATGPTSGAAAPGGQPSGPDAGGLVVAGADSALTAPADAAGSSSALPGAGAAGDGLPAASSAAPGAEPPGARGDAFGTAVAASGAAPGTSPGPAAPPQSAPAASAAPAPALPAQLHAPIARITALGPGEHSITVRLAPESLGPVTVRAHVDLHGVRVELIAAGAAGHDALKAILPELRRDLAHAGLGSSLQLLSGDPGSRGSDGQQLGSSGGPFSDSPLGTDQRERRAAEAGDEPGLRRGPGPVGAVEAQERTGLISPQAGIDLLA